MPKMYVVSIIQKKDSQAYFKPCGVGWQNRDGSINFKIDIHGDTQFHIRAARNNSDANEDDNA